MFWADGTELCFFGRNTKLVEAYEPQAAIDPFTQNKNTATAQNLYLASSSLAENNGPSQL
jgi:hypothetical protein